MQWFVPGVGWLILTFDTFDGCVCFTFFSSFNQCQGVLITEFWNLVIHKMLELDSIWFKSNTSILFAIRNVFPLLFKVTRMFDQCPHLMLIGLSSKNMNVNKHICFDEKRNLAFMMVCVCACVCVFVTLSLCTQYLEKGSVDEFHTWYVGTPYWVQEPYCFW